MEIVNEFEKAITLRVIDTNWMDHINTMSHLREGIYLRSYAQEDPLRSYTNEGFELFDNLLNTIDRQATIYLMKAEIRHNVERKEVAKGEAVTDSNKYNVPIGVDTKRRREPINWTKVEGIKSLKVDTNLWVL